MTKKQIITKCVEEKIKRGSIKKENRKKEIDARLNGIGNWLKPMNKNEYTSWYDDLFKPEYQIIKEELKEKINNWLEENNIEANYLDSEFYDNGNGKGLHIKIKWQQKEEFDNFTYQYFYHFKVKDVDTEAIFDIWVKHMEQVEQDKRIIEELEETKEERENKNIIRSNNQEQSERKKEISENEILKFEVGKKYVCSSVVNSNSRYEFEVIKRTEKTITIKNDDGEVIRRKVNTNQQGTIELIYPSGKYSMCLVLSADNIKEEKQRLKKQQEEQKNQQIFEIQSKNSFFIGLYEDLCKEINCKNYMGRFTIKGLNEAICYLKLLDKFQLKACAEDIALCERLAQGENIFNNTIEEKVNKNTNNVVYVDFRKDA